MKHRNTKRIIVNLLDKAKAQEVKKALNDNAKRYEHTVYINAFGSDDKEEFNELYKDILTEGKGRTCLNWCTCCQAPQEYSEEPTETPCNCNILFPSEMHHDNGYHIRYDDKENTYQYLIMPNGNIVIDTIVEEGDITDEQRKHVNNNITNKKLNADFSPSLVESICGKIKQQEQKNVLQFDMNNNSFVASENKHNISDVAQENKGWFHKAVGVPFLDFISCCNSNPDSYNMNL